MILEAFDDEKTASEENREKEEAHQRFAAVFLRGMNSERHREAAGQEDAGVDCAKKSDRMTAGLSEGMGDTGDDT
jgi:hypothetical protein